MEKTVEKTALKWVQTLIDEFTSMSSKKLDLFDGNSTKENWDAKLISLEWASSEMSGENDSFNDNFVDYVIKQVISTVLNNARKDDETLISVSETDMAICVLAMDFIFYSKKNRKNPSTWSVPFFAIFAHILSLLSWPFEVLKFWPYVESRIEWFKMCNSLEPIPYGSTNLISYKQPLFERLRQWNSTLALIRKNENINTSQHYILVQKIEQFLSELLTLHDESNYNRSMNCSTDVYKSSIIKNMKTTSRSSQAEGFVKNFARFNEKILHNPLKVYFNCTESKKFLDKYIPPLLTSILELEDEFYKKIKLEQKRLRNTNSVLNFQFPGGFDSDLSEIPKYLRESKAFNESRAAHWDTFSKQYNSNKEFSNISFLSLVQSSDVALYKQFKNTDNDVFRKQVIIQFAIIANLFLTLSDSCDVRRYYKSCIMKDNPSKHMDLSNIQLDSQKALVSYFDEMYKNEICPFYELRDPHFLTLLKQLLNTDTLLLKSKCENFKTFASFKLNQEPITLPVWDTNFKKFGFNRLGNKDVSNMWKIPTGIDIISNTEKKPNELYSLMKEVPRNEAATKNSEALDDTAYWRNLRSLRFEYLFQLNTVDEKTGIAGLFDKSLINESNKKNEENIAKLLEEMKAPHRIELEEAREYMRNAEQKKRQLEEDLKDKNSKRIKLENTISASTDNAIIPDTGESDNKEILQHENDNSVDKFTEKSPISEARSTSVIASNSDFNEAVKDASSMDNLQEKADSEFKQVAETEMNNKDSNTSNEVEKTAKE